MARSSHFSPLFSLSRTRSALKAATLRVLGDAVSGAAPLTPLIERLEGRQLLSAAPNLVSVNFLGTAGGNGPSDEASVTSDGRFIAFSSSATDLVPNDSNPVKAIYLRDTQTNTTTLVSVGMNGAPANADSRSPKVSDDGRFVVFVSSATNMVPNDTNGLDDIFIRDLVTGTTTRVSAAQNGGNASGFSGEPVISADGQYVAFSSTADNLVLTPIVSTKHDNVYIWNRLSGQTKLVSVNASGTDGGNGSSFDPSLSAGGNNVTFRSNSTDLESSIPTNGNFNVYLRNLTTSTTTLVSVDQTGTMGGNKDSTSAAVNNNGTLVVFRSGASNLVPGDQNNNDDVFLRDTTTNKTTLLSADFMRTGSAHGFSEFPTISNDGHYAAFSSTAPDLIPNNTNTSEQVYIRDLQAGPIFLVSTNAAGAPGNQPSYHTYLSANGQFATFTSGATDLTATPNNNTTQIYVASVPSVTQQPTPTPTPAPTPTPGPTPTPTPGADTTPPTATIDTEQTPPTTASPTYDFLVDLADNVALNTVSLGNLNVTAPGGAVLQAHAVNVIGSGPSAFAFYEFSPADNALATTDSGTYTVSAPPGAIKDAAGNDLTGATNAPATIGTFAITVNPANSADLVGTISGKFPGSVLAGAAGHATFTIKNQGFSAVTKAKINVNLYLSESPTLAPHSTAFRAVPLTLTLKPQKTRRVALTFKYPTNLPAGNYYLVAKIDPANVVPETNKVNNVSNSPVTINVAPAFVGLQALAVSAGSPISPTGKNVVFVTVKNNGNTFANGTLNVNLTAAPTSTDLTGTGRQIGTASTRIHLRPGATQKLRLKPSITGTPASGTFLSATIDPNNTFHNPVAGENVTTSGTAF